MPFDRLLSNLLQIVTLDDSRKRNYVFLDAALQPRVSWLPRRFEHSNRCFLDRSIIGHGRPCPFTRYAGDFRLKSKEARGFSLRRVR